MVASAHRDAHGEWVIPQVYYQHHEKPLIISRKKLLDKIDKNPLVQEAMQLEPAIRRLVEEAKRERCAVGYTVGERFYGYYKARLTILVGWESSHKALGTMEHYDAVYEAIYELLPGDEWDIYPDGIMPNGMYCPSWQEKYDREYP